MVQVVNPAGGGLVAFVIGAGTGELVSLQVVQLLAIKSHCPQVELQAVWVSGYLMSGYSGKKEQLDS